MIRHRSHEPNAWQATPLLTRRTTATDIAASLHESNCTGHRIRKVFAETENRIYASRSRTLQTMLLVGLAVCVFAATARCQSYPQRVVTIIVPLAPGGGADFVTRLIADGLRVRPGTSSRIAYLSQHEADGSEFEESQSAAIEVLPILGQSAATVQPSDRTFDNPTLG